MSVPVRIASAAVAAVLLSAGPARAADHCVKPVVRDGCTAQDTLDDALAVAAEDAAADRVFLGAGTQRPADAVAGFSDGGTTVAIIGGGPDVTTLAGTLRLSGTGSSVEAARLAPGAGAGAAHALTATATVRIQRLAVVGAGLLADGATLTADDVEIRLPSGAGPALEAGCDGKLLARHVTVTGQPAITAGRAACATAELEIRSSILVGDDPFTGPGTITTAFSAHAADPGDATAGSRIDGDPALGSDGRPAADSPAIDGGDPEPLSPGDEPFEDLAGAPRIADGDGDGALRRDAGAYERQPPPIPLPAGNVLANPGAEDGLAGWEGSSFEAVTYGTPPFPTAAAGEALGAGAAFFGAGLDPAPQLTQRIDVAAAARAIDGGGAGAVLSGLLGGYGADADAVRLSATFRDPEGLAIGSLPVGPVAPADRGNVTNLVFRSIAGAIPVRTRAIDVVIAGERVAGRYTDAYADNVGLVLSVPGVPVDPPVKPGPVVPNLRPFAGVTVLHPRIRVGRTGLTRIALACASATVRSCTGTLEARALLPRRAAATRIARPVAFSVAPGRRRGVFLRLLPSVRRAVRGQRSLRATLIAVAADGQGVQRSRTVPVRLMLPKPATRQAARR